MMIMNLTDSVNAPVIMISKCIHTQLEMCACTTKSVGMLHYKCAHAQHIHVYLIIYI